MAARIIKVAGLLVLAVALSAPIASAQRLGSDTGGSGSSQPANPYLNLNTPASDQGMQAGVVAPNDKAGTLGTGQSSSDPGIGGAYGLNLIKDAQAASKRNDVQAAKSFKLPLAPDDRAGSTSSVTRGLVVPYLSHGIGVDPAQFNGSRPRPDDRAGARPTVPTSVPTAFAAPVSSTGNDGFNWASAGIGAAGLASLALVVVLLSALMRRGRSTDVAVS
jgi:hypothetical protein